MDQTKKIYDVFISYSSIDKEIAFKIYDILQQNNINCWIDKRSIKGGDPWAGTIVEAIEQSRLFLLIFSNNSNNSKDVTKELGLAGDHCEFLIPFRIDDTPLSSDMRYHLQSKHWIDSLTEPRDSHIQELVEIILDKLPEKKRIEDVKKEKPTRSTDTKNKKELNKSQSTKIQKKQSNTQTTSKKKKTNDKQRINMYLYVSLGVILLTGIILLLVLTKNEDDSQNLTNKGQEENTKDVSKKLTNKNEAENTELTKNNYSIDVFSISDSDHVLNVGEQLILKVLVTNSNKEPAVGKEVVFSSVDDHYLSAVAHTDLHGIATYYFTSQEPGYTTLFAYINEDEKENAQVLFPVITWK